MSRCAAGKSPVTIALQKKIQPSKVRENEYKGEPDLLLNNTWKVVLI